MFNSIHYIIHIIPIILFLLIKVINPQSTLIICIDGIRNDKGVIRLAFYHNNEEFQTDQPFRNETLDKDSMANKSFCVQYSDLEPGIYGIALLDDENENFQMDYKLLIPEEGFGFSDLYPEELKKPKFDDFKFQLDYCEKRILIKIKYML